MRIVFLLLAMLLRLLVANGQGNILEKIRTGLEANLKRNPTEKVYLHLDRTSYMSGETVYFGIYTTEGYLQAPSTLSNTIYVELFNEEEKLLKRATIRVAGGNGNGHFDLADTLKSGCYQIRAYSNWMKNAEPDFFFQKDIMVFSLFANQQPTNDKPVAHMADIQFFPEGGHLVYGIQSKVGFKAVDSNGKGIACHGKVFDDQNREVLEFRSSHRGMGFFLLLPEASRMYYAVVDGLAKPVKLPQPSNTGFTLRVINEPTEKAIAFEIRTNIIEIDNEVTVATHCRGRLLHSGSYTLSTGILNGAIPRQAFLSGVNHITVFDKNQMPVAERLIYVDRGDTVQVNATLSDTMLGKRKKVSLDIRIMEKGIASKARLSVSVTDDSQVGSDINRENIKSYLLLTSDISGVIESPGYYFDHRNKDRHAALDVLLLTQGWRRFVWKRILDNEYVKAKFPVERGFHITGTMRRTYSDKPVPGGKVSFLAKDFKTIFGAIETDAQGRFHVADIQLNGSGEILFQGEYKKKRTDVWFDFDTVQVIPPAEAGVCSTKTLVDLEEDDFVNLGIARRNADERFEMDRQQTLLDEIVIMGEKIPTTVREKLQAKSIGYKRTITVETTSWANHPLDLLRGKSTSIGDCGPARPIRIFWNGVEIIHISQLNAMDPNMVSEIDTACDLIAFWTRRGSYAKSATSFMLRGYQPTREFYSPKYDVPMAEHEKEDYRATLEWRPGIQTDEYGRAHLEFYTSDNPTTVTIRIEGISSTGIPFAKDTFLTVVK